MADIVSINLSENEPCISGMSPTEHHPGIISFHVLFRPPRLFKGYFIKDWLIPTAPVMLEH